MSTGARDGTSRAWIGELQPGTDLEESYVVRSKDVRQRRGGGPYIAATLGDRTGEIAALVWENVEQIGKILEVGVVVDVKGQVQRYNTRLQIVIRRAAKAAADDIDETVFVRSSSVDVDILWQRLETLIEEIDDSHLKQLLFRIISDPGVASRFKVAPAA